MIAAAAEEDGRPRTTSAPATAAERAAAARLVAAEEIRATFVCRACALDVVERMVHVSVEAAEHALIERMKEQMQCPN